MQPLKLASMPVTNSPNPLHHQEAKEIAAEQVENVPELERKGGRRVNRRASTGGFDHVAPNNTGANMEMNGIDSANDYKRDEHLGQSLHSAASIYGYGDYNDGEPAPSEPSYMKALRRGSLSRIDQERKLNQSLAMVSEYNPDRDDKIQSLRDRFVGNKRNLKTMKRMTRRSSLSSHHSQSSMSLSFGADSSMKQKDELSSADAPSEYSITITADENFSRRSSLNMSVDTVQATNVINGDSEKKRKAEVKTDQIVESLVWFSFHTPRTVLEDLIAHEMEIWRRENDSTLNGSKRREKLKEFKLGSRLLKKDDDDDSDLSSLSDGDGATQSDVFDGNFTEAILRMQSMSNARDMIELPKSVVREGALLFVDMSGFTKLSTMLDVESLSKVINSYFDMIVSEVILHGGDILKFAGDAFFAEWKVLEDTQKNENEHFTKNPLADLNASLASINEFAWDDDDVPKLSTCTLSATRCATSIVRKFSDFQVTSASTNNTGAMLNVHCGIGVGRLVGLHVGDYKEDQEEEGVELRREFLILGSAIDQVSISADKANDGEVYASPQAIVSLAYCCDLSDKQRYSDDPVIIARREDCFINLDPYNPWGDAEDGDVPAALQPYESLRMHCKALNHAALARLHLQMALYVHPVIRSDEVALSAAIQAGKILQPTETLESRHRAEAELRSVYTMFIKAIISPRITGMKEVDEELYKMLGDIMHVTSRELDRYSGHLRQFIVDDKGVVLIATFGLRGSTFPNMVSNNALPCTFAIHRALKSELKVENRIGATFGKAYCGVVGGVRRHEFAIMGAPVNLAARLMSSKENRGILVDEAVKEQSDTRYSFHSLPPVEAKGYSKPVPILEPLHALANKKKKSSFPFIGRKDEKLTITSLATNVLVGEKDRQSSMVFLMGESGVGKSALANIAIEEIKRISLNQSKITVSAKSTSTETEQRIPLSSYRKIFMSVVRELCERDGTLSCHGDSDNKSQDNRSLGNKSLSSSAGLSLQSVHSVRRSLRARPLSSRQAGLDPVKRRPSLTKEDGVREVTGVSNDRSDSYMPPTIIDSQSQHANKDQLRRSMKDNRVNSPNVSPSHFRLGAPGKTSNRKSLASVLSQSHHDVNRRSSKASPSGETLAQSLHRLPYPRSSSYKSHDMGLFSQSQRRMNPIPNERCTGRDDTSTSSFELRVGSTVPYFEKLCWVCEQIDYPYEYADIVGSQFLGLDGASPVTHVDGHIPTMDELVEFLALAFICIADFADLTLICIDDFQWVDSFSWKIFRTLCNRGDKILVICAMRSHDKQALRRLSTAATKQKQLQSQMVEISLGPLDITEIRTLMAKVLGFEEALIPDSLVTDVFQATGGLPVYVVQFLENVKRKQTVELGNDGKLQWTVEGLKEKRAMASNKSGGMMEETFLSRFDVLDVRVRKVLQTCAVLGLSFTLSDVIQVHPEMDEADIEHAINTAVEEMILVEQVEDEDEVSLKTSSTGTGESDGIGTIMDHSGHRSPSDRFFLFSHALWRKNVLVTMLKERKIELHRLIAEAMEKDQVLILEQSDISRLLTLFDHWKSCGDFIKSAPLALAVGARLEEWDLSAQSLELYEDALEMSFECVTTSEKESRNDEGWVLVSAKPKVLDLILRLHIRIGLCHQHLGEMQESIKTFEDAYNIIKTSSKIPGMSKSLMMPIISSLCVLKVEEEASGAGSKPDIEKLLVSFYKEAKHHGNYVHVGRAISMQASYKAQNGELEEALKYIETLRKVYDFEKHSSEMVDEYGRDFALESLAESIQWYYLLEKHDDAEERADVIIQKYLPLIDPLDLDTLMGCVIPVFQVFKLLGRIEDAEWLLKRYVINIDYDHSEQSQFWAPLLNPLIYLLEINLMEVKEISNEHLLEKLEEWAMDECNSQFDLELERKGHTFIGELCWRLANFKEEDDTDRNKLIERAIDLLTPIAKYPHQELFLRHLAQALLDAL